jgi:calcium/calmodulin-dependent protein kinase I
LENFLSKERMDASSVSSVYEMKQELGKGAFSVVYLAVNKNTGEKVAIKIIDKHETKQEDQKRLKTEVEILKRVKHPNIICMKDLFDTPDKLYLVIELVTGGELFDKIVEKGQYSEQEASQIVRKILSAVEYLHQNNIAHRDLKPENLLLKGDDDTEVMLSDFGLSKIVGMESLMETACGTPYYVAPEVLSATGYDKEVDLWSVGVITYLLLCGFPPFYGDTLPEVFEQIMKADFDFPDPYWKEVSDSAKDFIKKLLVVDPKQRMSPAQALNHPWIANGGAKKILNIQGELRNHNAQRRMDSQKKLSEKKK